MPTMIYSESQTGNPTDKKLKHLAAELQGQGDDNTSDVKDSRKAIDGARVRREPHRPPTPLGRRGPRRSPGRKGATWRQVLEEVGAAAGAWGGTTSSARLGGLRWRGPRGAVRWRRRSPSSPDGSQWRTSPAAPHVPMRWLTMASTPAREPARRRRGPNGSVARPQRPPKRLRGNSW
ncbi:hypothetical protein BS78_K121500 [Paspalum vaginatum]|uniref:Uncharacterized protein n=1 Tax=Paspalum vaginatum TaxID=158149 RepID=A0A9W8CF99_9POAL|nr:hypothetical protein BS78_K121500 [Paspalum vaginatum]